MWPFTLRHQPFRSFYLLYELCTVAFIRIPFWIAVSIPKTWRPRPSWDLKRAVFVRLLRHLVVVSSNAGPLGQSPSHLALGPPGPDVNGVWVDGVPHLITGPLKTWSEAAAVAPTRIPGYWLHAPASTIPVGAPPMPGEKVVYSMHGGGYNSLSAHPSDLTAHISRGLLEHCAPVHRVFSIEYRLSAGAPRAPANPFPAALLDALAGYDYLVRAVGFAPEDIIAEGDSAGGNLAHALTRYLVEHRTAAAAALPAPPGALLLLSPWADLGQSHRVPGGSYSAFARSDLLNAREAERAGPEAVFLGPHGLGMADVNRYVSPGSVHPGMRAGFEGFPRTFIVIGGAEVLYDQIGALRDRMVRDLGEGNGVREGEGKVAVYEAKDGVHDYLAFAWHEPERTDTFKAIAGWVSAT